MTRFEPYLTGRQSRRKTFFSHRRRGAGWTRPFRKGRTQRIPFGGFEERNRDLQREAS